MIFFEKNIFFAIKKISFLIFFEKKINIEKDKTGFYIDIASM